MDCIFCKIVAGEVPGEKIYEDDRALAFLDINPVSKGHTLLIPKAHHEMMVDAPDGLVGYMFTTAKKLMKVMKQALDADFVVVSVVGVDVPHFHIHLVPRYHNDGLANWWPTKKYDEGEMQEYAEKIRQVL